MGVPKLELSPPIPPLFSSSTLPTIQPSCCDLDDDGWYANEPVREAVA